MCRWPPIYFPTTHTYKIFESSISPKSSQEISSKFNLQVRLLMWLIQKSLTAQSDGNSLYLLSMISFFFSLRIYFPMLAWTCLKLLGQIGHESPIIMGI